MGIAEGCAYFSNKSSGMLLLAISGMSSMSKAKYFLEIFRNQVCSESEESVLTATHMHTQQHTAKRLHLARMLLNTPSASVLMVFRFSAGQILTSESSLTSPASISQTPDLRA